MPQNKKIKTQPTYPFVEIALASKGLWRAFSGLIKRRHQTNQICTLTYTTQQWRIQKILVGGMIKILSTKPQKCGCFVTRRVARNSQWSSCFRGLGAKPPALKNFAFFCKNNWNDRRSRRVFLCFHSAIFQLTCAKFQTRERLNLAT